MTAAQTASGLITTLCIAAGCATVPPPAETALPQASATAREAPAASASAAPTTSSRPSFETSGVPPGWTPVANFTGQGRLTVSDALHASDAYLIAGDLTIGRPGEEAYRTEARLWRSTDARSWTTVALPDAIGLAVVALAPSPDGGFLLYGLRYDEDGDRRISVLRSDDGVDWTAAETDLPPTLFLRDLVKGGPGYVLLSERNDTLGASLWFSSDGISWDHTHDLTEASDWIQVGDLAAGSTGFVAFGMHVEEAEGAWLRSSVVSVNGRDWTDVAEPFGEEGQPVGVELAVSASGDSWVAAVADTDATVRVLRSHDGRTWDEEEVIDGLRVDAETELTLAAAGEELYIGIGAAGLPHAAGPDRIWRSAEPQRWDLLSFRPITTLGDVVAGPEGVILAGVVGGAGNVTVWHHR